MRIFKQIILTVGLSTGLLGPLTSAGLAQSAPLSGTWSGSGTVSLPSGATEQARCKATFSPSGDGTRMSATCATPSARIQQTADLVRSAANRFVGEFHNIEYGITGSIRILLQGNNLSASLSGGGGSASFNLSR